MPHCIGCGTQLGEEVRVCPICDAVQNRTYSSDLDNINNKLTSTPSIMVNKESEYRGNNAFSDESAENTEDKDMEIARLMKRGDECFNSGKAWIGAKDRTRARKEFQRAFNYYETILKLDPEHDLAREARAKCLFKMA